MIVGMARGKKKATWGGRREGAGRPARLVEPVDRWVRMERTDAEAAEQLAAKRGISLSELMRRALRMYVKRQKTRLQKMPNF